MLMYLVRCEEVIRKQLSMLCFLKTGSPGVIGSPGPSGAPGPSGKRMFDTYNI